jgi:hypothetical protein
MEGQQHMNEATDSPMNLRIQDAPKRDPEHDARYERNNRRERVLSRLSYRMEFLHQAMRAFTGCQAASLSKEEIEGLRRFLGGAAKRMAEFADNELLQVVAEWSADEYDYTQVPQPAQPTTWAGAGVISRY